MSSCRTYAGTASKSCCIAVRSRRNVRQPRAPRVTAVACSDDGGSSSAPACDLHSRQQRAVQLDHLREVVAAHTERLEHYTQCQDFNAAAQHRDMLLGAQLRLRQLELEVAAEERSCAGVVHRLGMVVVHRRYGYRGVIVGYDARCQAPDEWVRAMHIDLLEHGRHQPFYHVLVNERDRPGGHTTYVAQENIVPARAAREVCHPLLGRFFTEYLPEERAYLPGALLREEYPHEF